MARGKFQEWLTEDGLLRIESWARDGLTDKQIAQNIGVSERSFTEWKKRYTSISSALKKGKAPIDVEVENALLKRALGFEYEETKIVTNKYKNDLDEDVIVTKIEKVKKYAPPDTGAIIFWLKNRKPDTWRKMSSEMKQKIEAEARKLEAEAEKMLKETQALSDEMSAKVVFLNEDSIAD